MQMHVRQLATRLVETEKAYNRRMVAPVWTQVCGGTTISHYPQPMSWDKPND
jgi:hypothetical protein